MSTTGIRNLGHGIDAANRWIAQSADSFESDDRAFAYRLLCTLDHALTGLPSDVKRLLGVGSTR